MEAFLTDSESVDFLANALNTFPQPSAKSKADFETKTAPIHVSQSASGDYDLEELKKDAVWLSEQVKVEENIALRVVILEWQQRSEDRLLVTARGSDGSGLVASTLFSASTMTASFAGSTNGMPNTTADFGKEEIRRQRQLQIYLDEKSYLLKISTELANRIALQGSETTGRSWIDELAKQISAKLRAIKDSSADDDSWTLGMGAINDLVQALVDPSECPQMFASSSAGRTMFEAADFADLISALRLVLANLYTYDNVLGARVVLDWFKLMARMNFFLDMVSSAALPNPETLQCLVSITSVAILQIPHVLHRIQESAVPILEGDVQYPRVDGQKAYFLDDACLREINLIVYGAAQQKNTLAAPSIFGWSIISSCIRDVAKMATEIREQRRAQQEDESSDGEPVSRRRASRRDSSYDASPFEKQYAVLQDFELEGEAREDPPRFLAQSAVDRLGVYGVIAQLSLVISTAFGSEIDEATSFAGRNALMQLIQEGMPFVSYDGEVLEAILATLSPSVHGRSRKLDSRLVDKFFTDDDSTKESTLQAAVLDQALARYPFELSPLLRLLTALEPASTEHAAGPPRLVQLLEDLHTLTVMVPEHFNGYALENEDENANSMVLKEYLPLFESKQARSFFGASHIPQRALTMGSGEDERSNVTYIPAGAEGYVVKESRPFVFKLEHDHSGLEYLGVLLSTILPNSELLTAPVPDMVDRSTASEIISLITSLLSSSMRQHQGIEEARFVLGRFSNALHGEQDIISVLGDILEMELLAHLNQSIQDGSLELLVAAVEFFDELTVISPERVWSTLARSSLLGLAGGANALAAVVGGTEVQVGRFKFLRACVSMYAHLIDDALAGLMKRRAKLNTATNRFDSPMSYQDATPERTMSSVLSAYQTVMIDAWQSLSEWRFAVGSEKSDVARLMLTAFERLLKSTYGIDSGAGPGKGVSAVITPTATMLLDTFAPASDVDVPLQTFKQAFVAGLAVNDLAVPAPDRQHLIEQVNSASSLLTTLLRTSRAIDSSQKRAYSTSTQLLKLIPTFAALMATDHAFKRGLCDLLTEVVQSVAQDKVDSSTPSLLGQLSPEVGKDFLSVICQLDRPLRDLSTETSFWSFLSTVMGSRQQWFAIYLLTGTLPKDRLKDHKSSKSKSLLAYALEQLSGIASLAPEQAMAMLRFVASAQNTWVWATNEVRSHADFLKDTLEWLASLQPPSRAPNMAEEIILASEHQMAAYLCDILAVNLHAGLEIADQTVLKLLVPKLGFLRQHASSVNAYNRSLHRNLSENFTRKFDGCDVSDFERTSANPASFGRDFFYDLDLANRVLGHQMAWHGAGLNGRQQGFADEFARANVNLSLVEAQKALFASWRVLATTLCECVDQDLNLQVELAKTAERSLRANVEANLDVPEMDEVINARAEMTFIIVSKLVALKSTDPVMKSLLPAAWDLVRSSPVDYDIATASEDLRYYRTLLQVLYLAIQPHAYIGSASTSNSNAKATDETKHDFLDPNVAACLVEIVAKVVAPGFRALCGNLHTSIDLATPTDFALVTAILQVVLSIRGIEAVHPQITEIVANTSLVRGALSLYSWADQLAEVMDQDPVHGEVATMFLVALSTVRPIAEQMALEGVLIQLSSANLSNYFRKSNGKGPFDEPRRMFTIWTEAFLPLCLNLLDAVGPPITAEVSAFLDEFPEQLKRAETALENRDPSPRNPHAGSITLGLVSEAHDLCLIGLILESDIARGAAEGLNAADVPKLEYDYRKVKDDAMGLMRQKTSLASRIVAVGQREEEWSARSVAGPSDNLMQDKVVKEVVELVGAFGDS